MSRKQNRQGKMFLSLGLYDILTQLRFTTKQKTLTQIEQEIHNEIKDLGYQLYFIFRNQDQQNSNHYYGIFSYGGEKIQQTIQKFTTVQINIKEVSLITMRGLFLRMTQMEISHCSMIVNLRIKYYTTVTKSFNPFALALYNGDLGDICDLQTKIQYTDDKYRYYFQQKKKQTIKIRKTNPQPLKNPVQVYTKSKLSYIQTEYPQLFNPYAEMVEESSIIAQQQTHEPLTMMQDESAMLQQIEQTTCTMIKEIDLN